ncbi:toprim domain-containing protein [Methylophaga sp. OBS4]|uniref:toprim domain-containing protein n=1 Tax=Methylophaga sp. OBS4 TaxID=2991935 RepID=UPI00224DA2F3|nr:toprim domain-containing protein [Methylophaga sp. OBS4]MCX4187188.1 toprim domain-containing protein [Methylophaga sp. OBS4]
MQQYDLNPQIIDLLKAEFEMKEDGKYLRGRCPDCQKKELWTWVDKPGRVQCNRVNNCDFSATTKELFPELFEKLNDKYKPTEANPNATADAYMAMIRGFDLAAIKGWYEQGSFWHPQGDKGTATVRFFLDEAHNIMWERLIEDVTITEEDGDQERRNKNFKGSFKGLWWQPPPLQIEKGDEIHWCEGIMDVIAMNLAGYKAVAIMTSGMFPEKLIEKYQGQDITWVIALDNDKGGRKFIHKHANRLRDLGEKVTAVLTSAGESKKDWNDLHKAGRLTESNMAEYRHLGRLELATSYREKARLIYEHKTQDYFIFTFRDRTYAANINQNDYKKGQAVYWSSNVGQDYDHMTEQQLKEVRENATPEQIDQANDHAFNQAAKIREIATFTMQFLYFQQPDNGEDGQYFFRFRFGNGSDEQQLPFTGKTLSTAGDFKKAAMHKAPGAQFVGNQFDMDRLYRTWMANIPKVVRTLDYIGYDKDTAAYVFNDYAVQDGRIIELNNESFFQLKKSGIKTEVDIRQRLELRHNSKAWLGDFITAFSVKGVVALSWWFGCLFVEQIRKDYRSYPFFEVVGEAGSGKSDLVDFLWKLYGKEGESFNPNSSTLAGRTRKMAEVSNLPVVFNETDNEQAADDKHLKRFNWDEQKDLFDGEFGRVTGIKSQDNSTKKPRFKAGLMIVQNIPVQASEAILSRVTHLNFDRSHHSMEGKYASDRLNMLPLADCSGFLIHAAKQADRVMQHFDKKLEVYKKRLQQNKAIKLQRIVENHAKIMALTDCLKGVLPDIPDEVISQAHQLLENMAATRQESLNEDHPVVQQFWAQFDYLDSYTRELPEGRSFEEMHQLNHSNQPEQLIAVQLERFHQVCRERNLPTIDPKELRRHLPTSRKRKYKRNEVTHSRIEKRSVRCWIFER